MSDYPENGIGLLALAVVLSVGCAVRPPAPAGSHALTPRPADPLEELARCSFEYFRDWSHPETGLVWDRVDASGQKPGEVASSAATGFGLTALCIADARGWLPAGEAYRRAEKTLRFLAERMPHIRGFFYHFIDPETGERRWDSELSTIDTALLLAGVITCRQYWPETPIVDLADVILARVEWPWMLHDDGTLSMGWTPEGGFLPARWGWYNELMVLVLLGLASPTHPLAADAWHAWRREPVIMYGPYTYIQCPPLFTHQFSHAWIDFRGLRDAYADYFLNSVLATRAQHLWSMDLQPQFPAWGETVWGLSASDWRGGYAGWGGPPATGDPPPDGTIVPYAVAGSLPFAPDICRPTILHIRAHYADTAWGRYGFLTAFNPHGGWSAGAHLGIDLGITLLMIENARSGFVWERFMEYEPIRAALRRAGFVRHARELPEEERGGLEHLARDTWQSLAAMIHPDTGLPANDSRWRGPLSVNNVGLYLSALAAATEWSFIAEPEAVAAAERVIHCLETSPSYHGFFSDGHDIESGAPPAAPDHVSLLDNGHLAAGLTAVGMRFEALRARCNRLLDAMRWDAFYDRPREVLIGRYDIQSNSFDSKWTLDTLDAGARVAQFIAVGSGRVPASLWDRLSRSLETRYHAEFLLPGWAGGLVSQFVSSLWLEEEGSLVRRSAENLAYAQMIHAREREAPAWGWSPGFAPDGDAIEAGPLREDVIAPYATILALESYPEEVIDNIKALEKLGARDPKWGFRESIDVATGAVSGEFLFSHQAMIFLSLFNALREGQLRKWVREHPIAQRAYDGIAVYRERPFGEHNASYRLALPSHDTRESERARVARVVAEREKLKQRNRGAQ